MRWVLAALLGLILWCIWRDLHREPVLPVRVSAMNCQDVAALSIEDLRNCSRFLSQEDPHGARLRPRN